MKMKIIDALRLINEQEKADNNFMRVKRPYRGSRGKKIPVEDAQKIGELAKQGKTIKDIYRTLNGKYHYDTVWRYADKQRNNEEVHA